MSGQPTYLLDLSAHGRIRCTGEDRARLIHALSTNHIQQLEPGQGAYAFFLTAQGRIMGDANILCFADSLLLDVEPETRELLLKHIDHYIIADDVALTDESDGTFCFGVEGEQAKVFLARMSAPLPETRESHLEWENMTIAEIDATGAGGYRIYGPAARKGELWQRLLLAGAEPGNLKAMRVAHFRPRYGEDITDRTLAQETGLPQALHFQKGCYLGQEIVERVRSRGQVHRVLAGLAFTSGEAPPSGTELFEGDAKVGTITSASGKHAIAMLRMQNHKPGSTLVAAGSTAVVNPVSF